MPELSVSRKSIGQYLGDQQLQIRNLVIPDYQRPYSWEKEKCETLWDDIRSFAESITDENNNIDRGRDYFLGTIVSNTNSNNDIEIIDGQQRITSIILLLRAFYKKLENMQNREPNNRAVNNIMALIAPCIWRVDRITGEVLNRNHIHLDSRVVTENERDILVNIIANGEVQENATDNYSLNYKLFMDKSDAYAMDNPLNWQNLCVSIIEQCIILPIECDTTDTALEIFNTLNDRGMPLSDADIFKAKLYGMNESNEERKLFTDKWKEINLKCDDGRITINDLFRYYTHWLRATSGDKSKEIGLRSFYAKDDYLRLGNRNLLNDIGALADYWKEIDQSLTRNVSVLEESYFDYEGRKWLHVLTLYTNEFWKYPISVFFLKNREIEKDEFRTKINTLLKKLVSYFYTKYVEYPSVNAIKDDIYSACIAIATNADINLKVNELTLCSFKEKVSSLSQSRITKGLLLINTYLIPEQNTNIIGSFDIEHIFPKKWQNTNYNGWDKEAAEHFLEKIGNKVVFERRLNIQAGNGYFERKKEHYSQSSIIDARNLSALEQQDWLKEDIVKRQKNIIDVISSFFNDNDIFNVN